jgi:hypothetical protein
MKGHENKKKILQSQIMARGKNGEREKKMHAMRGKQGFI